MDIAYFFTRYHIYKFLPKSNPFHLFICVIFHKKICGFPVRPAMRGYPLYRQARQGGLNMQLVQNIRKHFVFELARIAKGLIICFSFTVSIILDRFYFLDAGFYAITNSALLGWLLCTLFFAACFVATRLIPILLTSREE